MCPKSWILIVQKSNRLKNQTGFRFWDVAANKQLIVLRGCTHHTSCFNNTLASVKNPSNVL